MERTIKMVYLYTHRLIKDDADLHRWIKKLVLNPEHQRAGKYLPTGFQVAGIYLGLDFSLSHISSFNKIITNALVIDNIANQQADLSRVLLRVMIDGVHVANLTEDISENGKLQVFRGGSAFGPCADYLNKYFYNKVEQSVMIAHEQPETVIKDRERISNTTRVTVRLAITELDHLELSGAYASLYQALPEEELELYTLRIN